MILLFTSLLDLTYAHELSEWWTSLALLWELIALPERFCKCSALSSLFIRERKAHLVIRIWSCQENMRFWRVETEWQIIMWRMIQYFVLSFPLLSFFFLCPRESFPLNLCFVQYKLPCASWTINRSPVSSILRSKSASLVFTTIGDETKDPSCKGRIYR